MLQDIDLSYANGGLKTSKSLTVGNDLTVGGNVAVTGTQTATTQTAGDNSTKVATTAYVDALRTATLTLTNKTMDGASNTFTNIAQSSITNLATNIADGAREFRPADQGMVSWAYDPTQANAGQIATNGVIYLVRLQIPSATNITKLYWTVATAGSSPTSSQNYVGLYDSAGNRLCTSGVDADISSQGAKTATVSSTPVTAGFVWFAMVFNASTAPSPLRGVNNGGSSMNLNLTAATIRFGTNGTSQTSLPSTITPASNGTSGYSYWVGIG